MSRVVLLKVKNEYKKSTELNYEDLIQLYKQYIEKYNTIPKYVDCLSKNNLPQGRIITKILKENNILYGEFLLLFNKNKKARTEYTEQNYQRSVSKLIELSKEKGTSLTINELTEYGLPNAAWFIKYCPDKTIKTYSSFLNWCGLEKNSLKIDKNYVEKQLKKLENKLKRPILREDIYTDNVGFSMVVINRLYGGLDNAKKEIGLKKTNLNKPLKSFDFYKTHIDNVLSEFSLYNDRKYIGWMDIENIEINGYSCEHKSIVKAFKREGIDFYSYLKSKGYMMNPSKWSYKYTFDDGENVVSSMEYDVSNYLRKIGYEYNKSYFRDVRYSTFTQEKSKINCDYKIILKNKTLIYIEVAGMIYYKNNLWRKYDFKNKKNNDYRDKMIKKEKLLNDNNCNYLFLFPEDFYNNEYQNKINEVLNYGRTQ